MAFEKQYTNSKKIHVYEEVILRVVSETEKYYVGFDILTEQVCQVEKTKTFFKLCKSVLTILKSEEARVKLAMQIDYNANSAESLLGISKDMYAVKRNQYTSPKISKRTLQKLL
jgi:hypothetical protein